MSRKIISRNFLSTCKLSVIPNISASLKAFSIETSRRTSICDLMLVTSIGDLMRKTKKLNFHSSYEVDLCEHQVHSQQYHALNDVSLVP